MKCNKCEDTGWYTAPHQRGTVHSVVCNGCCTHSKGSWLLLEHYGDDNGRWCCLNGCGTTWDTKRPAIQNKLNSDND